MRIALFRASAMITRCAFSDAMRKRSQKSSSASLALILHYRTTIRRTTMTTFKNLMVVALVSMTTVTSASAQLPPWAASEPAATLRPAPIPGPGYPQWRRADACRQNGPGASWRCGSCLWRKQRACTATGSCYRLILRPTLSFLPPRIWHLPRPRWSVAMPAEPDEVRTPEYRRSNVAVVQHQPKQWQSRLPEGAGEFAQGARAPRQHRQRA